MKTNNATILIVDDTETNIDILLELLHDYDVIVAMDGETALEIVIEENIDLILLDILMPDMDGYEVCERLKCKDSTRNIPVIFITARTDENSIEKAYDVGGLDFVTKPFKAKELLARVKTQIDLNQQKEFITSLLNSLEQIVITTNGDKILSANARFLNFFGLKSLEDFNFQCISHTFYKYAPKEYLQNQVNTQLWIDFVIDNPEQHHKVIIQQADREYVFTVSASILVFKENAKHIKVAVFSDITVLEKAKQEIEVLHKQTKDSIEYASVIQSAILPNDKTLKKHFRDFFTLWLPKDIIGGDIYFIEELNDNEIILMVIDCTGHGVPGAFVTMLVKAIERQFMSTIQASKIISPAAILGQFNQSIKQLLQQENSKSLSNVGFDGLILHSNKSNKTITFAAANTAIFMIKNKKSTLIKGDRHSIGYNKSDAEFQFTDHCIDVSKPTKLYITTDGYIDQTGGDKGFSYGKKRFLQLIKRFSDNNFADQKNLFMNEIEQYENERKDDITVIALSI